MTEIPQITALPAPPQRGQDAALFVQLADAFIDALPGFRNELNVFGAQLVAATIERVVNEAAESYAGALNAKNLAIAARDDAQGYAASINPASFVKLIGDQTIDGGKTFAKKIIASLGIRIGDVDLTTISAAGKALIEAADTTAQRLALGTTPLVQDFDSSGTWTKPTGAKLVSIIMWGGGGGGGGSSSNNGGSGGAGAGYVDVSFLAGELPSSVSVTIGAGGAGGPLFSDGSLGGASLFGTILRAPGGVGGPGGNTSNALNTLPSSRPGGYGGGGGGGGNPGGAGGNLVGIGIGPTGAFCPGGGGGSGASGAKGADGGLGVLRGAVAVAGGGGVGGVTNNAPNGNPGGAGLPRLGAIPGTGGGGGSYTNSGDGLAAGGVGGAGGSGAGGGGAGNPGRTGAVGGAGGAGFCRVITFF